MKENMSKDHKCVYERVKSCKDVFFLFKNLLVNLLLYPVLNPAILFFPWAREIVRISKW